MYPLDFYSLPSEKYFSRWALQLLFVRSMRAVSAPLADCIYWQQFHYWTDCSVEHSERQHRENEYRRVRAWIWSIISEVPESGKWEILQLSSIRGQCEGKSQTSAPIMGSRQWHRSIGSSQQDTKAHWDSLYEPFDTFSMAYYEHWWNNIHLHI